MNFLAPLYIIGTLAISLPILFHLIKRTPQGKQVFSSLMFLTPSPPRVTRKSRLSNILLLLLRAAALTLLAMAFARPYLSANADLLLPQSNGRRIAILVDTSASMRRSDLWQQAGRQVDAVLNYVGPTDEVSLFLFDKTVRPAFSFSQWNELSPDQRSAMLKHQFSEVSPTWASTNLGEALSNVADLIAENDNGSTAGNARARQIVLISDLQQGSHAEALQKHQWPSTVSLDVKRLTPTNLSNAGMQLVRESADQAEKSDGRLRVRVSNQVDSTREQFSLAWADEKGPLKDVPPATIYVPPGRSQVVRVAWPTTRPADRLILTGDDSDFDNTLFVVQPRQQQLRIFYCGKDASDDPNGLRFYLERATTADVSRKVGFIAPSSEQSLEDAALAGVSLAVVDEPIFDQRAAQLRNAMERGTDVLWILSQDSHAGLEKILQSNAIEVVDAPANNFSLLANIAMDHPLFAPFAEARFADFTKIHFWKHRVIKTPSPSTLRPIASFDNGDPFLLEATMGISRLWILTSSWRPADSQLALSNKFVPLVDGMIKPKEAAPDSVQHNVGDPIAIPLQAAQTAVQSTGRAVRGPDGHVVDLAKDATTFDQTDRPGIYHVLVNGEDRAVAVNVAADETRTTRLPVENLEQYGARFENKGSAEREQERTRQLKTAELENKQKLWRWIIIAALGILTAEIALAGKLTRKQAFPQGVL